MRLLLATLLASLLLTPAAGAAVRVAEFPVTRGSAPTGIAVGADGNLWFTEQDADRIGRITPTGVVTDFSTGITPGAQPDQIAAGPDGNLWFTEHGRPFVGRITPAGVVTEFPVDAVAYGITAGPDGRMWFTGGQATWTGDAVVGAIDMAGRLYRRVARLAIQYPYESGGIATGPGGDLWFLQPLMPDLGRVTTTGSLSSWPMWQHGLNAGAKLNSLVLGPDGNMWASGFDGTIARITDVGAVTEWPAAPGRVAIPREITTGPDGALWFTAVGLNALGRITTDGEISYVTAGISAGSRLWDVVTGPDGAVWFTEPGTDWIGRLDLHAPEAPPAPTPDGPPAPGTPTLPALPGTPSTPGTPSPPVTPPAGGRPSASGAGHPGPSAVPASCATRAVTVTWTRPAGTRLRGLVVRAGGRTTCLRPGFRSARVVLGAAGGTVRLTATTTAGARLRAARIVAPCAAGPLHLGLRRAR